MIALAWFTLLCWRAERRPLKPFPPARPALESV